jgi:hypothetical protein
MKIFRGATNFSVLSRGRWDVYWSLLTCLAVCSLSNFASKGCRRRGRGGGYSILFTLGFQSMSGCWLLCTHNTGLVWDDDIGYLAMDQVKPSCCNSSCCTPCCHLRAKIAQIMRRSEHRRLVANRNPLSWIDSECFRAATLSFSLVAGNRQ